MASNNQIIVFNSTEQLVKAAEKQASTVDQKYQHSTYLYFIARYFVSVFESRNGVIPVQVWNEYRNALDHFFRFLTSEQPKQITDNEGENITPQLHKMEGHLQRAALDIIKIHCHKTKDSVDKIKNDYKAEVIQLVDNGGFNSYLIAETNRAESLFERAKIYDNNLGETAKIDKEVLNKYLEAVFAFDALKIKIIDKTSDLEIANNNYNSIHDNGSKGSTKHHYFIHFTFYIFWTVFVFFCALIWEGPLKPMAQDLSAIFFDKDISHINEHNDSSKDVEKIITLPLREKSEP